VGPTLEAGQKLMGTGGMSARLWQVAVGVFFWNSQPAVERMATVADK
jgi:hypothetical protein